MTRVRVPTSVALSLLLACCTCWVGAQMDFPFYDTSLSWEERVDDLVARLTVDEITEQMMNGGRKTHAPAIPRLGISAYGWGAECLHGAGQSGPATSFPQAIGLAAIFSASMHFQLATAFGEEVRSKHNNYSANGDYGEHTGASCWSPNINILRDPRWGRNQETYGEDPYLTGVLAQAFVTGLQGNHPRYVRANAGCKHFASHSGPENIPENRFQFNAVVTERDFRMTFLPAFKKCVEAGTYSLMCSYNAINGVPACANNRLLTEILREEWGFTGYVISDELAMENIRTQHHYTDTIEETCQAAVRAGCNLEDGPPVIPPEYRGISNAVALGMLNETEIREAVKALFYTRMRLGHFDPPDNNPFAQLNPLDYVQSPAHQDLSLRAALRSFVLLKNSGNFLPLSHGTLFDNLAIVGPMSDNIRGIFGNYSPDPDPNYVVTPLKGLSPLGRSVRYAEGCLNSNTRCPEYNQSSVISAVTGADLVILCVGTGSAVEAEANDRPDINFPGEQLQLIQDAVANSGSAPVILLLFNGGPLDVTWAKNNDRVVAIVECFFPGQTTGDALRNMIYNEGESANPGGRLPNTWPANIDQYPPIVDYTMINRTYRYFNGNPLYSFGYGLSYTSWRYLNVRISPQVVISPSDVIRVEVDLINAGPHIGEEVVQIYVSWNNPSLPTPKIQLVGFDRVRLSVGSTQVIKFEVQLDQLAVWNDSPPEFVVLDGEYTIYAGGQQPNQQTSAPSNVLSGSFTVQSAIRKPKSKLFD